MIVLANIAKYFCEFSLSIFFIPATLATICCNPFLPHGTPDPHLLGAQSLPRKSIPMKQSLFRSPTPRSLPGGFRGFKCLAAALLLAIPLGRSARAATQYWDVNGNGTWNTTTGANNWSPNSTGNSDTNFVTGNDAVFSSGTITTPTITITTTALAANSVTFDGSSSTAYTFTNGGTLTLGNATTGNSVVTLNSGAGAVTFQGAIVLAQPSTAQTYTITNNSSNLLTFGGTFTESFGPGGTAAANTTTVVFNGSGGVTFNGAINGNNSSNPGGSILLSDTGTGILSFNTTNNAAGVLAVSGSSTVNVGSALALQDFNLQMNTGSTVNFTGGITAATIAGLGGPGGTLTLTNTGGQAVVLTLEGASLGNGNAPLAASPTSATNIAGLGSLTIVGVTSGGNNTNAGTETLTGVLSFTGAGGLNVANTGSTGPGNTAGNNTMTLVLQGADTYTGPTTVGTLAAVGTKATLTVNQNGSIANSSAYTVNSSTLNLTPGTANTTDMVNTSGTITLTSGATPATTFGAGSTLTLTGNTTNSVAETFASLAIGSGNQTVSITGGSGKTTTLTAGATSNSFIRSGSGTALIRGTNLGAGSASGGTVTGDSYFTLGDGGASLVLVGSNLLSGGTSGDATQALKIVPYLFGDVSPSGNGANFLTYDSVLGFRVLTAAEDTTLTATSVTAANPVNAVQFNGTVTSGTGITVNSLLFSTSGQTLNGSGGPLNIVSGAVAAISNDTLGSGWSSLTLGNGEGVITVASGDSLTLNTAVNVTGAGSDDLIKTGAGTLNFDGTNSYTGPTVVNQGTLAVGGTLSGSIVLTAGGTLSNAASLLGTVSGNITGAGAVAPASTGTLALTGSNSYSSATAFSSGVLQAVANAGNTVSGTSYALSPNSVLTLNGSTLQLRADSNTVFTTAAGSGLGGSATINVANISTGANNILTLNNFAALGTNTLTVTAGNGDILGLGAINGANGGGTATLSPSAGASLLVASFAVATGNNSILAFTGAGNTTFTGALTANGSHNLQLTITTTGTVTLDGENLISQLSTANAGSSILLNSGALVLNNANPFTLDTLAPLDLGNTASSTTSATLFLGGTNAPNSTGIVTNPSGGVVFDDRQIFAQTNDTGTLTIGGLNTSGTNILNYGVNALGVSDVTGATASGATIILGGTNNANSGKSVGIVQATGGTMLISGTIAANGTDTTAGVTFGDTTGLNNGTVILTAANTYGGASNVLSGVLELAGGGSLAGSAVTVGGASSAATLLVSGNDTIGTASAGTLTLTGTTGTLSMVDGAINTLTLANNSSNVLVLGGSDTIDLEVSAVGADKIVLSGAAATASVTGTDIVNVTLLSGLTGSGTDTLISAPGGGLGFTAFSLGSTSGAAFLGSDMLVDTGTSLLFVYQTSTTPATAYFTGAYSNAWNTISSGSNVNFTTDSAGTMNANQLPGSTTNVHFYATDANTANLNTVLGQNFIINSLNVDGTATGSESSPVSIGGSNTLTIMAGATNGNTLGNGINVGSGAGAVTISAAVALGGSNTWTNNSANAVTVSGNVTGGFALTTSGTGAIILSASDSYTGATAINAQSTLQLGSGGTLGSISTTSAITDNGNLSFDRSNTVTEGTDFAAGIAGTGSVTQAGTGVLTLNAANSFSGGLILASGTVSATTSASALGGNGTGNVNLASGATATLLGDTHTFANPIVLAGNGTLTIGETLATNNAPTFSGNVSGAGNLNLTNNSSGIITLSGTSINNAGTIMNSGAGVTGNVVSTSGALNGLQASTVITGTFGPSVTGVFENSTSDLFLAVNNPTYTGGITIQSGRIDILNNPNVLGAATDIVTLGSSSAAAYLNFNGNSSSNGTLAGIIHVGGTGLNVVSASNWSPTFTGAVTLEGNGTTNVTNLNIASLNNSGSTLTFTGGVSGTGNIVYSNDGNFFTSDLSFTTAAVNNAGTITFNNAAVFGGVVGNDSQTNTITGGVGSNVTAITQASTVNPLTISNTALTVNSGSTTLTNSSTPLFTVSGGINGTGNLVLDNNSTTASGISITTTTVNNAGTITNAGTGTGSTLISANIGANVTQIIENSASSNLTLGGANTAFAGQIIATSGTIQANAANAVNNTGILATVTGGALDLNGYNATIGALTGGGVATGIVTDSGASATLTLSGSATNTFGGAITGSLGFTVAGTTTETLTGSDSYTGATTINSGATLQLGDGTTGHDGTILSSSGITDNGSLIYDRFGSLSSGVVISGSGAVTVSGPGSQTFTAANTYNGATTINSGATLQLGNGVSSSSDGSVANSAITDNGTLVYNYAGAESTSQTVTGSGNLTVAGPGSLTVNTGAHLNYTGTTSVTGTLIVLASGGLSGSLPNTSAVNIATGGVIDNDGTINSAATVNLNGGTLEGQGTVGSIVANGGTLAAGAGATTYDTLSAGPLTATGNVTLSGSTTFSITLGVASAGDNNSLAAGGTASLSGSLQLVLGSAFSDASGGGYLDMVNVILTDGALQGQFAQGNSIRVFNSADDMYDTFNILYNVDASGNLGDGGTDVGVELISVGAVPEPGTWAMILSGTGMLFVAQRARRRSRNRMT
jgi:autotransporter-associated beta strand protein